MRRLIFPIENLAYPQKEKAYALTPSPSLPFSAAVVGITYPHAKYRIDRPASDQTNVFEFILEGEGEIFCNGEWKTARAGDTYVFLAGEQQHYRANPKNPWKKLWINYFAAYLPAMCAAYGVSSGIYRAPTKSAFEELFALVSNEIPSIETQFALVDTLHKIIRLIAQEQCKESGSQASKLRDLIHASVYKKIDLEEIAKQMYCSKSTLIRNFKRAYKSTPYDYLLHLKIEAAKRLLKNTGLSVKEIADKLAIEDEHYFSNLFLARVGFRPKDYRKQ